MPPKSKSHLYLWEPENSRRPKGTLGHTWLNPPPPPPPPNRHSSLMFCVYAWGQLVPHVDVGEAVRWEGRSVGRGDDGLHSCAKMSTVVHKGTQLYTIVHSCAHNCAHNSAQLCKVVHTAEHNCAQWRTAVHNCAQFDNSVHCCPQLCTIVHKCVHKRAQLYTNSHNCAPYTSETNGE